MRIGSVLGVVLLVPMLDVAVARAAETRPIATKSASSESKSPSVEARAVTSASSSEGAATTETASDPKHERARELFREGNEAYRARELERARSLYQDGLRLERSFDLVCNLGRTEADLRDDALALSHLDECLKEYPPGEAVAAAREKFFHLREVVRERCRTKNCSLKPASASGDAKSVAPAESGAAAASGTSPLLEGRASEGGASDEGQALQKKSGPSASAERTSERDGTEWKWPVTIGVGVLGLAAAGAGVGFWLAADARQDEANLKRDRIVSEGGSCAGASPHPLCASFGDSYGAANTSSTLGVVGFASGGVLLAGAAVLAVFWDAAPSEKGTSRATLVPLLTGSTLGAGLVGTFE